MATMLFNFGLSPFQGMSEIDTHLFGASMTIKVHGSGKLIVKCIPKSGARRIKEELVNFNNKQPTKGMLI